jgi:hypothetical protein
MIADIVAYFFIFAAIVFSAGVLILFSILAFGNGLKKALPLLWMGVLAAGFVWALFQLGVM